MHVKVAVIFQIATYKYSDQKWYKTLGFYWKQNIMHLRSLRFLSDIISNFSWKQLNKKKSRFLTSMVQIASTEPKIDGFLITKFKT